jgi:hypothetical protein
LTRPAVPRVAIARAIAALREAGETPGGVLLLPDRSVAVLSAAAAAALGPGARRLTATTAEDLTTPPAPSPDAALDQELAAWESASSHAAH